MESRGALNLLMLMTSLALTVRLIHAKFPGEELFRWNHVTPFKVAGDYLVKLNVLHDAVAGGAVCLDGSPPAYNFDKGFGSGKHKWLVNIEGGGWCVDITSCAERAETNLGSSLHMGDNMTFEGILSNQQTQNPEFYNWNRVFVRYCDGSSFTGDVEEVNQTTGNLYFRGQRIWKAVMKDLLAKGMNKAHQALLTGCSAGGSTTFFHCDKFRKLFPKNTTVKCMADAGYFLDGANIAGQNIERPMFKAIVTLHGSIKNLPSVCASLPDPSQCFFPQYIVESIGTPLFILNAAYDSVQVGIDLAPALTDPNSKWQHCKQNISNCASEQLNVLQDFRHKMITALKPANTSKTGGLFINSCYTHCQAQTQRYWHSPTSPKLNSMTIAEAVGDWYFGRRGIKFIDCPYPCDVTCVNDVFSS